MSANICWAPENPEQRRLSVAIPSRFQEMLKELDMELPYTFSNKDVPVLRGMAVVFRDRNENPFYELIEAIEKYDRVRVWAEY